MAKIKSDVGHSINYLDPYGDIPLHESERCKIPDKLDMIHELTDAKLGVAEVALRSRKIGEILYNKNNISSIKWIHLHLFLYIFAVLVL